MSYRLVKNVSGPPGDAVCFGNQTDGAGQLWSAVAHTEHGPIAGKANRSKCFYSFGGEERVTPNFSWLTDPAGKIVKVKNSGSPPPGAVSVGKQQNEGLEYYAAIAICDYGFVPGKAKGNECWYAYDGEEHCTANFYWLVCQ